MALNYTTDAGTMTIPSAGVSSIKVETSNSGLSTNGVLVLVGEADAGPRFDAEASLQDNAFGPDEISAIVAKYGSGPLVDACIQAANPSNDPNIVGGPARIIPVKTNLSVKAKAALSLFGGGELRREDRRQELRQERQPDQLPGHPEDRRGRFRRPARSPSWSRTPRSAQRCA
jgi:hypothetical protein